MRQHNPFDTLNDLAMSEKARPLLDAVKAHIRDNVDPITEEYYRLGEGRAERFSFAPGQLELLEGAKAKAKKAGLWNFFLPNAETGEGLSNLDYAYIAAELGKNPLASQTLNCSAPDTGNMEVLERVGTPEQKEKWLKPLLAGEIRSAFAMTEPAVASSDARNIRTQAVLDGDEWVINGEKYYISGAGDPRCKIMIVMCVTSPEAEPFRQQSQILVPMETPGVRILGPMRVFGHDHAPHGHMHLKFENVRVPKENLLGELNRGFPVFMQGLDEGRLAVSAMAVGMAQGAMEQAIDYAKQREQFGKTIVSFQAIQFMIAEMAIEIEAARCLLYNAARLRDAGLPYTKQAAMLKAFSSEMCLRVVDKSLQIHGGNGYSADYDIERFYRDAKLLTIGEGTSEINRVVVAGHVIGR